MNRFDRIIALLIQLQARRVVRGPALAAQLGVSLRTIYRDLRTLEEAGVPVVGEAGVGYSLADGYRLPPVMFSREEALALHTAEKLAAELTDAGTAGRLRAAMDKLRAVLRAADREYLEALSPRIDIRGPTLRARAPNADSDEAAATDLLDVHQRLLTAVAAEYVVRLRYRARHTDDISTRDVEPVGLYYSQHWHLIAFCRLRQDFRDFRLDRFLSLTVLNERFAARPEALDEYHAQLQQRRPTHVAVVRFGARAAARARDDKHYFGWTHEAPAPDGALDMTFVPGDFAYLARWLLTLADDVSVISPPELLTHLRELARVAWVRFGGDERPA